MKPIRGSRLTPNDVQEECIRVTKVYDWVFDAITTDKGIELPREYAERVEEEVAAGRTPLEVTCEVPDVGGFFPLDSPDTCGDAVCTVSSRIERREIPVNGTLREVGIINLIFTIRPLIKIYNKNGRRIGSFRPTISESRRLVVCAPKPFTSDNIHCRIISLNSDTTYIETGVPDLGLRAMLDICFEVQVEAEVKLEVLAKFCFPRENDIEIPTYSECPPFEWPKQCNFFPRDNCDCQAFVDTDLIPGPVDITFAPVLGLGTLAAGAFMTELNAEICDNCTLAGSTIQWIVEDIVIPTGTGTGTGTTDQSFVFTATEIGMPECEEIPGGISRMVVRGTGTVDFADPSVADRTVAFTLTLVENAGSLDDTYSITLFDLGGTPLVTFAATAVNFVPDEDLVLQDCVTFPDLLEG